MAYLVFNAFLPDCRLNVGVVDVFSRFGAAVHDDVTPSDSCKPAPCVGHHGDESDEPPEHYRQHGRQRSGAERLEPRGHLRH